MRRRIAAVLLVAAATAWPAQAQQDLGSVSIEELLKIQITSAGRREQPVSDTAAAVYVITHEDILRSGVSSLPELLRLVPGVQVARVNASKWAVSVRGFNGVYSNKLLVLVDGRSVYTRMFSGVLWDDEDLVLDDVERIEVIRGSGAVNWGANAVNGVINIVTRQAADTRGAVVRLGTGSFEPGLLTARYGTHAGGADYRVYMKWTAQADSTLPDGANAGDYWHRATGGFRADWARGLTLTGNASRGTANALWIGGVPDLDDGARSVMTSGSLMARYTHAAGHGSLQLQGSFEAVDRDETIGRYGDGIMDAEAQYHARLSGRHDLVAGAGVRVDRSRFDGRGAYVISPAANRHTLIDAFGQDDISLAGGRAQASIGARLEHDIDTGAHLQPTARLLWHLSARQQVWAAASRALRTPALIDQRIDADLPAAGGPAGIPALVTLIGNPRLLSEAAVDLEAGYRLAAAPRAAVSIALFDTRYRHLRTMETGAPLLVAGPDGPWLSLPTHFDNLASARTRGGEVDGCWTPAPWWRLDGSVSLFHISPSVAAASDDVNAARSDANAPARQWQLHSATTLGRASFDARLMHVGALRNLGVPAYDRLDLRVERPIGARFTAALIGQNLLTPFHREFVGTGELLTATRIPRSVRAQITWRH